jgi:hypothetical protein
MFANAGIENESYSGTFMWKKYFSNHSDGFILSYRVQFCSKSVKQLADYAAFGTWVAFRILPLMASPYLSYAHI